MLSKDKTRAIRKAVFQYLSGLAKAIVGLVVIIFIIVKFHEANNGSPKPHQPEQLTENIAQAMAVTLCKDHVKNTLRSPSTADFPFFNQAIYDGKRRATLASYVDAQNGFGATIRTNFVCVVEYNGGGSPSEFGSWKIVDFAVLQ